MIDQNDEHVGQIAIVKDGKVLVVMVLNGILYDALTGPHTIVDLKNNEDAIDSTYSYSPTTRKFFKE